MPANSHWPEKTSAIATVLTTIAAIATAVGAIWIPIAIDNNAKTTRSVEIVGKAAHYIDGLIAQKVKMDDSNKPADIFSPEYINLHRNDVQALVNAVLNEYDALCSAVNLEVVREDILQRFRGDALTATLRDYQAYIQAQRKVSKNAWTECDGIASRYAQAAK